MTPLRRLQVLVPAIVSVLFAGCQSAPQVAPPPPPAAQSTQTSLTYWPADDRFPGVGRVSSWKAFRYHNEERRALFAAHRNEDQDGLVFVGDSITEGWHSLATDFADLHVKVVNRGIGGDTTPNLLYRLQDDVLSLHPRGLVILIGTNDIGEHTAPEDIAANLKELHSRIRAACPAIPIAWCLVMPRGDKPECVAPIQKLNALVRELADTDPRVTVCDTYTPLATPTGTDIPDDFKPDHLHLVPAGYAQWREALQPILASWHLDGN